MRVHWLLSIYNKPVLSVSKSTFSDALIWRPMGSRGENGNRFSGVNFYSSMTRSSEQDNSSSSVEEFRKLELYPSRTRMMARKRREPKPVPPPRFVCGLFISPIASVHPISCMNIMSSYVSCTKLTPYFFILQV